jgi:hypothetical protein
MFSDLRLFSWFAIVSLIIIAFGAGLLIGNGPHPLDSTRDREAIWTTQLRTAADENAFLRDESRGLRSYIRAHAQAGTPLTTQHSIPEYWRTLADLQHVSGHLINLDFVREDGRLSPDFAAVFALNEHEAHRIQAALDRARRDEHQLEKDNAQAIVDVDGTIHIAVQAFPNDGGACFDTLALDIASILGPNRNSAFQALLGEKFEGAFSRFGAQSRQVQIKFEPSMNAYEIRDTRTTVDGSATSTGTAKTINELNKWLGPLSAINIPPSALSGQDGPTALTIAP